MLRAGPRFIGSPEPKIALSPFRVLCGAVLALLLATAVAEAGEENLRQESMADALAAFAVSDFEAHGPRPDDFRKVQLRFHGRDQGERRYMLCGEAWIGSGRGLEWVDFATIATDPYEQWIGGLATALCADATPADSGPEDRAPALRSRLERSSSRSGTAP